MHCTACKVRGGNQIYGGAGRCHKQAHTAHPRRNKVRGGARKKKKRNPHSNGHTSPCTGRGRKFLRGLSKAAACYFSPGQVDCVCRSVTECWWWSDGHIKGVGGRLLFGEPTTVLKRCRREL